MSNRSGEADVLESPDVAAQTEPKLRSVSSNALHTLDGDHRAHPADSVTDEPALPHGFFVEDSTVEALLPRLARLERRARVQFVMLVAACLLAVVLVVDKFVLENVIVQQTLMESKEITLIDNDGTARLFIRMYSKVPVLQIMDSSGKPRMSLGLRFDDTPFVDLSDARGRTRATFEMTEKDEPALRMFDENGNPTFNIN